MKLLIVALLGVGALLGVVLMAFLIGLFLPRAHEETGRRELMMKPDQAWAKLTDFAAYPEWQPSLERVEVVEGEGRLGTVLRQTRKDGKHPLTLQVTDWEELRRLVLSTADPDLPFTGTWTFELADYMGGTELRVTERGEVPNPLMRTMWRLFRPGKSTVQEFLEAL